MSSRCFVVYNDFVSMSMSWMLVEVCVLTESLAFGFVLYRKFLVPLVEIGLREKVSQITTDKNPVQGYIELLSAFQDRSSDLSRSG